MNRSHAPNGKRRAKMLAKLLPLPQPQDTQPQALRAEVERQLAQMARRVPMG